MIFIKNQTPKLILTMWSSIQYRKFVLIDFCPNKKMHFNCIMKYSKGFVAESYWRSFETTYSFTCHPENFAAVSTLPYVLHSPHFIGPSFHLFLFFETMCLLLFFSVECDCLRLCPGASEDHQADSGLCHREPVRSSV